MHAFSAHASYTRMSLTLAVLDSNSVLSPKQVSVCVSQEKLPLITAHKVACIFQWPRVVLAIAPAGAGGAGVTRKFGVIFSSDSQKQAFHGLYDVLSRVRGNNFARKHVATGLQLLFNLKHSSSDV